MSNLSHGLQMQRTATEKREWAAHCEREIFRAMGTYTAALLESMRAEVAYSDWRQRDPETAAEVDKVGAR